MPVRRWIHSSSTPSRAAPIPAMPAVRVAGENRSREGADWTALDTMGNLRSPPPLDTRGDVRTPRMGGAIRAPGGVLEPRGGSAVEPETLRALNGVGAVASPQL